MGSVGVGTVGYSVSLTRRIEQNPKLPFHLIEEFLRSWVVVCPTDYTLSFSPVFDFSNGKSFITFHSSMVERRSWCHTFALVCREFHAFAIPILYKIMEIYKAYMGYPDIRAPRMHTMVQQNLVVEFDLVYMKMTVPDAREAVRAISACPSLKYLRIVVLDNKKTSAMAVEKLMSVMTKTRASGWYSVQILLPKKLSYIPFRRISSFRQLKNLVLSTSGNSMASSSMLRYEEMVKGVPCYFDAGYTLEFLNLTHLRIHRADLLEALSRCLFQSLIFFRFDHDVPYEVETLLVPFLHNVANTLRVLDIEYVGDKADAILRACPFLEELYLNVNGFYTATATEERTVNGQMKKIYLRGCWIPSSRSSHSVSVPAIIQRFLAPLIVAGRFPDLKEIHLLQMDWRELSALNWTAVPNTGRALLQSILYCREKGITVYDEDGIDLTGMNSRKKRLEDGTEIYIPSEY